MSDPKAERLLNLTMALLATKRYLTKNEIFSSVDGYSGQPDSKERMFERDKDDLRSIGIEIEVGQIDPYFEDELGYRIKPDNYGLELDDLSPRDLALISIAASSWQSSTLSESSQSAFRKLRSLGIPLESEELGLGWVRFDNPGTNFDLLWDALENRQTLEFDYASASLPQRRVRPYGLSLRGGFWYLVGFDLDRNAIRVFKTSRMNGKVSVAGRANSFQVPDDFRIEEHLRALAQEPMSIAQVLIRKGKCLALRNESVATSIDDEWDSIDVNFYDSEIFVRRILWFGPDARVQGPAELVAKVKARLNEVLS
ncbi:MAG: WYL domain-containing protein [Actinomycetes bacterium]|jgi:proteasome accessory factor B